MESQKHLVLFVCGNIENEADVIARQKLLDQITSWKLRFAISNYIHPSCTVTTKYKTEARPKIPLTFFQHCLCLLKACQMENIAKIMLLNFHVNLISKPNDSIKLGWYNCTELADTALLCGVVGSVIPLPDLQAFARVHDVKDVNIENRFIYHMMQYREVQTGFITANVSCENPRKYCV